MKPPKSIFNPTFKYVPAASTDIRKTFERIKAELMIVENVVKFSKESESKLLK